jgi:hypothetical protein
MSFFVLTWFPGEIQGFGFSGCVEGTVSTCARSIQTKPNVHVDSTLEKYEEDHLPHPYVASHV